MKTQKFSLLFRIIHWSMAFLIFLILLTLFLRETWLDKHHIADILGSGLSKLNIKLSQRELISLAKQVRAPMWDYHLYAGYGLIGVYVLRLFALSQSQQMPLRRISQAKDWKEKLQFTAYILFYIGLALSLFSGMMTVYGPESIAHTMEDLHKLSLYYLIPYILIHFAGICLAERGADKGIVSRLLSGK